MRHSVEVRVSCLSTLLIYHIMFISNLCKVFLLNYNDLMIQAISQIIEKEKKKSIQ
jgi:hypothetical protein